MSNIRSWFKPRFVDGLIVAFTFLFLATFGFIAHFQQSRVSPFAIFHVVPLLAIHCGFAAFFAAHSIRQLFKWWPALLVYLTSFAALWFVLTSLVPSDRIFRLPGLGGVLSFSPIEILWMVVVTAAVVFVLYRVFVYLLVAWRQRMRNIGLSRIKVMIAAAIILFALLTARNLLMQNDSSGFSMFQSNWFTAKGWLILLPIFAGVIPALLAFEINKRLYSILAIMIYWFMIGGLFLTVSSSANPALFAIQFGLLIFFFTGTTQLIRTDQTILRKPLATDVVAPDRSPFPSLWGTGVLGLLVAMLVLGTLYDAEALTEWPRQQRWQVAREIARVKYSRGVVVETDVEAWKGLGYLFLTCDFSDDVDSEFLNNAATKMPFIASLYLKNMNPRLRANKLSALKLWNINVEGGEIGTTQFNDLANACSTLNLDNVRVKNTGSTNFATARTLYLQYKNANDAKPLIDELIKSKFDGKLTIHVQERLNENEWRLLGRLSQTAEVGVAAIHDPNTRNWQSNSLDEFPMDIIADRLRIETRNILSGRLLSDQEWEILLETNASFENNLHNPGVLALDANLQREFWDAVFGCKTTQVFGARGAVHLETGFNSQQEFLDTANEYHFLFTGTKNQSPNANGQPTGLYMPCFTLEMIQRSAKQTSLEILSFDDKWLPPIKGVINYSQSVGISVWNQVGGLTNLRRLYLPFGVAIKDLSWFSNLKRLEHLQLDLGVGGVPGSRSQLGFRAIFCPLLRSIKIYGKPTLGLLTQFAQLPELETITFVDVDLFDPGFAFRAQVDKAFKAGVELKFVLPANDTADIPVEFQRHRDRVREQVRKQHLQAEKQK